MTSKHFSFLAFLALTAACSPKAPAPAPAHAEVTDPVVIALTIVKAIQAAPAKSDSILKDWHYTADSFEKLLTDIAADSSQSARYKAGMR